MTRVRSRATRWSWSSCSVSELFHLDDHLHLVEAPENALDAEIVFELKKKNGKDEEEPIPFTVLMISA